ncbi:polysaccharide pyruvyl transferase family protein [Octadecabacter sp. G9-8]|uniref:Polysaccharide pyruvyl transferase family protein n=1 Tax=Octadecabacter dasysiphoniae TaxID=2909341 RepID=A0ABS9D2C8_9RHOB|nr:polysaccharide pyruvyl transferase family protein [Octadecabacter dasysiphoniae]MCF2872463.1 polysaccharide pyruvyl transferase family protein [Octadecabacter dasysiphoniae]
MNVVFQHLRDTPNLGDRWCSPFDWFDWPDSYSARDLRQRGDAYDVGIYGGGKIFGGLPTYDGVRASEATLNIAWGVGTLQSFPISRRYARARRMCDVIGSRDYKDRGFKWVPCASCMAPAFDAPADPEHDVVFYGHGSKSAKQGLQVPDAMPKLTNNADTLEDALSFIASGRTVISNSYHGVYWGLLMGRKVICVPFSNKFNNYREAPAYATPRNWLDRLDSGIARMDMLSLCRAASRDFYGDVMRRIEGL